MAELDGRPAPPLTAASANAGSFRPAKPAASSIPLPASSPPIDPYGILVSYPHPSVSSYNADAGDVRIASQRPPRASSLSVHQSQKQAISGPISVTTEISSMVENASKQATNAFHQKQASNHQGHGPTAYDAGRTSTTRSHATATTDAKSSADWTIGGTSNTSHTLTGKRQRAPSMEPRSGGFVIPREGPPRTQRPGFGGHFQYSDFSHYLEYTRSRHLDAVHILDSDPPPKPDASAAASRHLRGSSSFSNLFRSNSEPRRSWSSKNLSNKLKLRRSEVIPHNVVIQKTANGTKYGRIISDGMNWTSPPTAERVVIDGVTYAPKVESGVVYGIMDFNEHSDRQANPSTFQVNEMEKSAPQRLQARSGQALPLTPRKQKDPERTPALEQVKPNGIRKSNFAEAVTSSGNGSPPTSMGSPAHLSGKPVSSSKTHPAKAKTRLGDISKSPPPVLPLPRAESLHFDSMTFRMKEDRTPARSPTRVVSPAPAAMLKTESQYNLQEMLTPKKSSLSSMFTSIRHRSRSPGKKARNETKERDEAEFVATAPDISRFRQHILHLKEADAGKVDKQRLGPTSYPTYLDAQKLKTHIEDNRESGTPRASANAHSKSPSMLSTGSMAEDCQSDASSAVLSDAQSGTIYHGVTRKPAKVSYRAPPLPGPAPMAALPSVPEGQNPAGDGSPVRRSESKARTSSDMPGTSSNSHGGYSAFPPKSPTKRAPSPSKPRESDSLDLGRPKAAATVRISNTPFPQPPSPERPSAVKDRRLGMAMAPGASVLAELVAESTGSESKPPSQRSERAHETKMRDVAKARSRKSSKSKCTEDATPPNRSKNASTPQTAQETEKKELHRPPTPIPFRSQSSSKIKEEYLRQQQQIPPPQLILQPPIIPEEGNKSSKVTTSLQSLLPPEMDLKLDTVGPVAEQSSQNAIPEDQVSSDPFRQASQDNQAIIHKKSVKRAASSPAHLLLSGVGSGQAEGDLLLDMNPGSISVKGSAGTQSPPSSAGILLPGTSRDLLPGTMGQRQTRDSSTSYPPGDLSSVLPFDSARASIESRISRLERSNLLLVKAFMAVVDPGAGMSSPSAMERREWHGADGLDQHPAVAGTRSENPANVGTETWDAATGQRTSDYQQRHRDAGDALRGHSSGEMASIYGQGRETDKDLATRANGQLGQYPSYDFQPTRLDFAHSRDLSSASGAMFPRNYHLSGRPGSATGGKEFDQIYAKLEQALLGLVPPENGQPGSAGPTLL